METYPGQRQSVRSTQEYTLAHLAGEGHHMVLAQTEDVDIAHNNHLVVVLCEDGISNNVCMVPGVSTAVSSKRRGRDSPGSLSA